ncbi:NUDIX domain-containing protein [Methanoculleus sp. FWC-SCC1]|uniref:NUDIX domain-containing protein n=1 Tax=Methanoculleus frigidifontis TaxID=2584085 RepID=A0ABT8MA08_9EURY|nr:NUDIX domain-containing protein [Methanoculleus sp. FWC-SCC1]MDN7024773.1 NUDIX domain-containing protein [Methanoculleus sp. FWC-SCC1]
MQEKPWHLAVSAVIRSREGKALLLRRAPDDEINPGKWDLPGGKPDPGETFDRALRREVAEETGMHVLIRHVAGAGELELTDKRIAYLIMECDADTEDVRLSPEHDEYGWFAPGEIRCLDLAEQFAGLFGP